MEIDKEWLFKYTLVFAYKWCILFIILSIDVDSTGISIFLILLLNLLFVFWLVWIIIAILIHVTSIIFVFFAAFEQVL